LPDTVGSELGDYLALTLTTRLGVVIPDRLDPMLNCDIRQLCETAWTVFDKPAPVGFVQAVRSTLRRLLSP
jgi:hypothetical protein